MADVEAPLAEAGPNERSNEPIQYDESLLIMVKGKVQQPKQPDHTESRLLIQKLQQEITKRGDRIKEIKAIEEQLRSNAKGASSGNKDVFAKLKELRDQRGTIIRQKTAIRDELSNCDGARDAVRAQMRAIRDKTRFINPEKIEQDLRDLEFKLAHETLSEQEEKRVQAQVQALQAARPAAKQFAEFDARLKESESQRAQIIARLKESDGVISELDVQIQALNGVLDEAKAKADAHASDLPNLQVEKKENYEIMVTLRAKIDELRKQNDAEYQEFIKRDRAFRAYQREQRRKKYEERQKEREERDKMRAEEGVVSVGDIIAEPYSNEIFTCEQLLTYLRSFTAVKEEVKEEVKQVEVPAGLKPFKRQEVVDEMFTGVPKKAPVGKGGKAAPAPAPKAAEPAKPKVQKLNHTLDMLKVFLQLNVEPPTTTSGIPATIDKVEARKAEYKQKQVDAKNAPPPQPKAAAAAANGKHAALEDAAKEDEQEAQEPEQELEPEEAAEQEAEQEAEPESSPLGAAAEELEPSSSSAVEQNGTEQHAGASAEPEAPASAAADDEPVTKQAPAAGTVGVTLKVDGEKVSLSVQAA